MQDDELKRRRNLVAEEHGGICAPFEVFYLYSIEYAASRSVEAFSRFDRALKQGNSDSECVASVQEALTHAAALSRYFWPSHTKDTVAQARGSKLRAAFSLNNNSPLYDKSVRNAFEHFDERLDQWLLIDHAGFFFPRAFVGDHSLADESPGHIFRLVDPDAEICVLLGRKYCFGAVRSAVQEILNVATMFSERGGRLPTSAAAG